MSDSAKSPRPSRKIRVGLIGAGTGAIRGHIPVLRLLPDDHIVALHSRQSRRRAVAQAAAQRFGIGFVAASAAEDGLRMHRLMDGVRASSENDRRSARTVAAIGPRGREYSKESNT